MLHIQQCITISSIHMHNILLLEKIITSNMPTIRIIKTVLYTECQLKVFQIVFENKFIFPN